jgi:hypothetical protein
VLSILRNEIQEHLFCAKERGRISALGGKEAPRAYHNTWCWLCLLQCAQIAAQMFMVLGNGRSATQRSGLEHILSSIHLVRVVAVQAGI